jgi:hypothetical protein
MLREFPTRAAVPVIGAPKVHHVSATVVFSCPCGQHPPLVIQAVRAPVRCPCGRYWSVIEDVTVTLADVHPLTKPEGSAG